MRARSLVFFFRWNLASQSTPEGLNGPLAAAKAQASSLNAACLGAEARDSLARLSRATSRSEREAGLASLTEPNELQDPSKARAEKCIPKPALQSPTGLLVKKQKQPPSHGSDLRTRNWCVVLQRGCDPMQHPRGNGRSSFRMLGLDHICKNYNRG